MTKCVAIEKVQGDSWARNKAHSANATNLEETGNRVVPADPEGNCLNIAVEAACDGEADGVAESGVLGA